MTIDPETIQHTIDKLIEKAIEFGPRLLIATLFLVIGYFVGRWVGKVMHRWLGKRELDPPVRMLMVRIVWLLVMGVFC